MSVSDGVVGRRDGSDSPASTEQLTLVFQPFWWSEIALSDYRKKCANFMCSFFKYGILLFCIDESAKAPVKQPFCQGQDRLIFLTNK